MSALSYLCGYESDSDKSDCESEKNSCQKRAKLPTPNLSKVPVVPQYNYEDHPQLHDGRQRSFPHVRGNWATFVFVQYPRADILNELLDRLEEKLSKIEALHRCDDFHVSLSKTVVLKYHLISAFSSSLQTILRDVESIDLGFHNLKVYCNEDNSRTFISLEVDPFSQKFFSAVSKKVDQVLEEFQLPTFYEDPSFHMSIFWMNGNKKSELSGILESLNNVLSQESENYLKAVLIDSIHCKVDGAKGKVFINPKFNRSTVSNNYPNTTMHLNPRFTNPLSNAQSSTHNNKIYVNPNFMKCTNLDRDTELSKANIVSCFKSEADMYNSTFQVTTNEVKMSASVPTVKSRYCLVRKNNTEVLEGPVVNIPKTTIKVNKYKSIALSDIKRNLANTSNGINQIPADAPYIKARCVESNNKKRSSSTSNKSRNQFKLVNDKIKTKMLTTTPNKKLQSQSKHRKSMGNLKKNNIPCPTFRKFGKCLRKVHGNCEFLHDKKHVAVCRKFIKGLCHDKECVLSHDLTTKKMPTCYFYLQGTCTKSDCPYLHVKLSEKVKVCPDFQKGYCESGSKCLLRHINVTLHTKSKAKVIESCIKTNVSKIKTFDRRHIKKIDDVGERNESNSDIRYYQEGIDIVNQSETYETIKPVRCKLGTLPSYIQL